MHDWIELNWILWVFAFEENIYSVKLKGRKKNAFIFVDAFRLRKVYYLICISMPQLILPRTSWMTDSWRLLHVDLKAFCPGRRGHSPRDGSNAQGLGQGVGLLTWASSQVESASVTAWTSDVMTSAANITNKKLKKKKEKYLFLNKYLVIFFTSYIKILYKVIFSYLI